MSTDAKLLYGLLLDRMGLSAKNGWYDDMGAVFIYYTLEEIQEDLNCGRDKAMKLLAELDIPKGVGLIQRVRQGRGGPPSSTSSSFPQGRSHPRRKPTSRGRKIRRLEVGKIDL